MIQLWPRPHRAPCRRHGAIANWPHSAVSLGLAAHSRMRKEGEIVSLSLSKPDFGSAGSRAFAASPAHLRIKDLAHNIELDDAPYRMEPAIAPAPGPIQNALNISLRTIDDRIYALASATTALDLIETKLAEAYAKLALMRDRGEAVDGAKIERLLQTLADHVNQSVNQSDSNYVNLLRDARIHISISELNDAECRAKEVNLTLISLEKLIAWRLKERSGDAEAWMTLIDQMMRIASRNLEILSSLILTLFAARDYTREVVGLVTAPPLASASRARELAKAAGRPNRLMAFLREVAF